jgi:hypothetical protein
MSYFNVWISSTNNYSKKKCFSLILYCIYIELHKKETKRMCMCLLFAAVHCKRYQTKKRWSPRDHIAYFCVHCRAVYKNRNTSSVTWIQLLFTVLYPSRSCLYWRAISGTNGSFKREEEKLLKIMRNNRLLRQDLDHTTANKSIAELWKWSMPVTNCYEEYQDKSHHWN